MLILFLVKTWLIFCKIFYLTETNQREVTSQLNTSNNMRPNQNVTLPGRMKNQNTQLNKIMLSRTGEHQNEICEDKVLQDRQETDREIYINNRDRMEKLAVTQEHSENGYGQSLWSSYDSPPMDFDSDTCLINCDSNVMDTQVSYLTILYISPVCILSLILSSKFHLYMCTISMMRAKVKTQGQIVEIKNCQYWGGGFVSHETALILYS